MFSDVGWYCDCAIEFSGATAGKQAAVMIRQTNSARTRDHVAINISLLVEQKNQV
jgi:hypothetical protein